MPILALSHPRAVALPCSVCGARPEFQGLRGVRHELLAPCIPPDARLPLCSPNISVFTLKCRAQLWLSERSCPGPAGMGRGTPRAGTGMIPGTTGWVGECLHRLLSAHPALLG